MSIQSILSYFINIDEHLITLVQTQGYWVYPILFIIIFCETGLVLTPFLPGDSMIFVTGTLASSGALNLWLLFILFVSAAIIGDSVNYWIGHKLGPRVFKSDTSKFFNKKYLVKAHDFYEKYGGKAIIYARFMPIVRTFVPFIAGIGSMTYPRFFAYNVIGGILWVVIFLFGGYFFGQIPFVQNNLTLFIILILVSSVIPVLIEYIKQKLEPARIKGI